MKSKSITPPSRKLDQFTPIQQHLNYIPLGLKDPSAFPGGLVSNHSLNGTPEFAYGITDWWEVGLYLPFSIQEPKVLFGCVQAKDAICLATRGSARIVLRRKFQEFSNERRRNSAQTRFAMEICPIIGVRNADWEFIVNPIVDIGFGKYGQADFFAPAARVARRIGPELSVGLEYYADFGQIGNFASIADQQHDSSVRGNRFQARCHRRGFWRRVRVDARL